MNCLYMRRVAVYCELAGEGENATQNGVDLDQNFSLPVLNMSLRHRIYRLPSGT